MDPKKQTQDLSPGIREPIDRVGVENVRTHLTITRNGIPFIHLPLVDVFIDLKKDKKGIHMSRLIETINEVVSKRKEDPSLEQVGKDILDGIARRHEYDKGQVTIKSQLLIPRLTPASKKQTYESYDVVVQVTQDGRVCKYLEVTAIGSNLCPHSLELTGGKAHIQRAVLTLGLTTDFSTELGLEDMADICDACFSSPTYMVVKGVDEKYMVEHMFENPMFVEDLARECLGRVKTLGIHGMVYIKARTLEAIHKHDAVSEIEREI
jgi:GTP cyclohydrolase-4